jgi:preprotein translocase subunit SecA
MRREVLGGEDLRGRVLGMFDEISEGMAAEFFPARRNGRGGDSWDLNKLNEAASLTFRAPINVTHADLPKLNTAGDLSKLLAEQAEKAYYAKEQSLTPEIMRDLEKMVLLTTIDQLWKDHLLAMDHLREGINLRGYGQKDPLLEYKKEGFNYFQMMYGSIAYDVVRKLFEVQVQREEEIERMAPKEQPMVMSGGGVAAEPVRASPVVGAPNGPGGDKVGRNDPCPCGSGKKYKKCHGA